MRCSVLMPAFALTAAFMLAGTPAARADTNVHGVRAGTQHSPSVAMSPRGTYVLSYDRVDATTSVDALRLALSVNGAATFSNLPLPTLPANWYWRPDAHIAYDYGTGQVWMVGQARSLLVPTPEVGIYVASGFPQLDGTIVWFPPILLYSQPSPSVLLPNLALATEDGSGAAYVLLLNPYEGYPGTVKLYRIQEDLGFISSQDLAASDPGLVAYTAPSLVAGPNGMVVAGWIEISTAQPDGPAPFVTRTSHDSGTTFGPEEFVASIAFNENGPGSTLRLLQLPTLLIAKHSPDFPQTRVAFWAAPYTNGPISDPSEIWLGSDCCEGTTWTPDPGTTLPRLPGSYEVHPAVTMADDGYFYLGWHDFQPYDPDSVSRFMVARLWNMGFTSSEPVPLAAQTFDWDTVVSNLGGMGWQSGVSAFQGGVTFAWGDHRGADPDVYARAFRAGGFALTEGCGDTLEVTAGQEVHVAWRIENRNELFSDEYAYIVGSIRPWTNGMEQDTVVIAPDASALVSYTIAVPDTAADAVIPLFPSVQDHARPSFCTMYLRIHSLVDVAPEPGGATPGGTVALAAPRPNPTAGPTALTFSLPAPAAVDLAIYDLRGRRVAILAQGELGAGEHAARWDSGREAPGVYFVRLTVRSDAGVVTRERRLVILR